MAICSLLLATCLALVGPAYSSPSFEGCFRIPNFPSYMDNGYGQTHNHKGYNVNDDCAHLCATNGFILAITYEDYCYCHNILPPKEGMIKPLEVIEKMKLGETSPCNKLCSGIVKKGGNCVLDECCGGRFGGENYYSVYAVGGINAAQLVIRRIHQQLHDDTTRGKMAFFNHKPEWTCHDNFVEHGVLHGLNMRMNLEVGQYDVHVGHFTVDQCKEKCIRSRKTCQSITYNGDTMTCSTNYASVMESKLSLTEYEDRMYERNCTSNIHLQGSVLKFEVVDQQVLIEYEAGKVSHEPLGEHDYEIDLTNSNNWDTLKRTVSVTNSNEQSISTQSGLEQSKTDTSETDRSSTVGTDSSSENTWGVSLSESFTSEIHASGSVSAGFNVGFASGSVTVSAETSSTSGRSSEASNSNTKRDEKSTSKTKSTSRSQSKSRTNMYNNGYTKNVRNDITELYDYSMTVMPLHKGSMSFFLDSTNVLYKVRTMLQLAGYVKFSILERNGHRHNYKVHVSRLLPYELRQLAILSTSTFKRNVIKAVVSIRDKDGILVTDESQAVDLEKE